MVWPRRHSLCMAAHRLHSSMLRLDRLWRLQMTTDRLRPSLSVPCRYDFLAPSSLGISDCTAEGSKLARLYSHIFCGPVRAEQLGGIRVQSSPFSDIPACPSPDTSKRIFHGGVVVDRRAPRDVGQ